MNRTENFIAPLVCGLFAEATAGTVYGWANLLAAAFFFVCWFNQMRSDATRLDR